jgi:hypothetical protein
MILGSKMKHLITHTCFVMAEILLSHYDYYHSFRMQTHLTTNLKSTEIEKQYGLRVRSRLREMFNLVRFRGMRRIRGSELSIWDC